MSQKTDLTRTILPQQRFLRYARRGFTLIELMISLAIVSMLASALLVGLTKVQESAKQKRCDQQIKKLESLPPSFFP